MFVLSVDSALADYALHLHRLILRTSECILPIILSVLDMPIDLHYSQDGGTEYEEVMFILLRLITDLPTDGYRPGKGERVYDRGGLWQSHHRWSAATMEEFKQQLTGLWR
jgi:hypothetical protein